MPQSGYPTPDEPTGDVIYNCIPVVVPDNPEFERIFAAAIYGLYASMSKPYFWRATGTMSPETAAQLAAQGLAQTPAYDLCGEDCSDELLPTHQIITYDPQDPHTEPETVPDGYLLPPFWVFGEVLPEFITDWFGGLIGELTGYNLTDVLLTVGSFPILADWFDIVGFSLPYIAIETNGIGTLELHLLAVPFGGRALITIDELPTLSDIVSGLWNDSDSMVDTVLDITSIPPETATEIIIEREVTVDEPHIFYVTFIPVIDDEFIPLGFGGGLRSVVWCGDTMPDCEECPECPEGTIEELLADDVFFETEYIVQNFGEYYSETVANETAQAAAYDGTPQSIAPDAPVGAPDDIEKNALCAAVHRFVSLYASTKLCLIQSKNFVEILWTKLANAANNFYDVAVSLMSPIYSPNIFSCFVSDAAAITALQDDAAIEEVACHIYDELKAVTMSQANFDAAVLDAATSLTGDAQKIACLMQNDGNLSLYINFLEGYQITLQKSSDELPDCPCETGSYRLWVHDFSQGAGPFYFQFSGTSRLGEIVDGRAKGTLNDAGSQKAVRIAWDEFDPAWKIHSVRMYHEQTGAGAVAGNSYNGRFRPFPMSNTSAVTPFSGSGVTDAAHVRCQFYSTAQTGFNQLYFEVTCDDLGECYIDRIEIVFVDGFAPSGAFTEDNNLCT